MPSDLFAGIPVSDYPAALEWYERTLSAAPCAKSSSPGSRSPRPRGQAPFVDFLRHAQPPSPDSGRRSARD
jgi:hypothetical protein